MSCTLAGALCELIKKFAIFFCKDTNTDMLTQEFANFYKVQQILNKYGRNYAASKKLCQGWRKGFNIFTFTVKNKFINFRLGLSASVIFCCYTALIFQQKMHLHSLTSTIVSQLNRFSHWLNYFLRWCSMSFWRFFTRRKIR